MSSSFRSLKRPHPVLIDIFDISSRVSCFILRVVKVSVVAPGFTHNRPSVDHVRGRVTCLMLQSEQRSGIGLQKFQEKFVHGDASVLFDAAEMPHGFGGGLTEERKGHDEFSCPSRVFPMPDALIIQQGFVERVLKNLDCLHILYIHRV